MRHQRAVKKLGRTSSHRKAMLRNMLASFFQWEKIETTTVKAKVLRPLAEKIITLGKKGDLHARRLVLQLIPSTKIVHKLFTEIAPRFESRLGGYTRIIKTGYRAGDKAPMSVIELVQEEAKTEKKKKKKKKKETVKAKPEIKKEIGEGTSSKKEGEPQKSLPEKGEEEAKTIGVSQEVNEKEKGTEGENFELGQNAEDKSEEEEASKAEKE